LRKTGQATALYLILHAFAESAPSQEIKFMSDDLDIIRVITRAETQKMVGLSPRTWDRLEEIGDVPPKTRLSQGRIGYRVADIMRWLDQRRETAA
jgi:predicted DNA-binding transcriptional regulator AlpA